MVRLTATQGAVVLRLPRDDAYIAGAYTHLDATHMHTDAYTHIHVHTHVHTHIHIYTHTHTHKHVYTHTHTHTHTHIHT